MTASTGPVHIVGIGDDGLGGLTQQARDLVTNADLIVGPPRSLALLSETTAEQLPLGDGLASVIDRIATESTSKRIVVLVGGDPLFYGVAHMLVDRLGKQHVEIVPHVSSMQLAFARVKEDWDDAYLGDLARHSIEQVIERIRGVDRAGLFASETWSPDRIAQAMQSVGLSAFRVFVCENLGNRNEMITQGTLAEIADMQFGPLAVMILVRESGAPDPQRHGVIHRLFGNPDDFFRQSRPKRGLLTPAEVRVLALSEMNLQPGNIVWDVGAGSGAVAVEAARLVPNGKVFAVEPDIEDADLIRANAADFGVSNINVLAERAPAVFAKLPSPDAVFLGGLGRDTGNVVESAYARLNPGGSIVANLASIENVHSSMQMLRKAGASPNVLMVQFARGMHQLDSIRFQGSNPSFVISVHKPR